MLWVPVASALVFKATKDGVKLVSDTLRLSTGSDQTVPLRLVAMPLSMHGEERFVLLSFELLADKPVQSIGEADQRIDVAGETMARVEIRR